MTIVPRGGWYTGPWGEILQHKVRPNSRTIILLRRKRSPKVVCAPGSTGCFRKNKFADSFSETYIFVSETPFRYQISTLRERIQSCLVTGIISQR